MSGILFFMLFLAMSEQGRKLLLAGSTQQTLR